MQNRNSNPKSKAIWIILIVALSPLLFLATPTLMILLVGLMPTITILITDKRNLSKIFCIGGFNFAGIVPVIIQVINEYSLSGSLVISMEPFNLLIMYGLSALGAGLYYILPNQLVIIYKIMSKTKLESIKGKIEVLVKEWGTKVLDK